jgi:hypothetical protein
MGTYFYAFFRLPVHCTGPEIFSLSHCFHIPSLAIHTPFTYWLLLESGVVQNIPCTATIFWPTVHPYLSSNYSWFNHKNSGKYLQRHLVATQEETWREMSVNLAGELSVSSSSGSLTCRKILRYGTDGFTFASKEVELRIFIALKNPSYSAGIESPNLVSNGKHYNH